MTARPTFRVPRRSRTTDDDRVLPLINVVFLLLIFFMLAGHLSASDPFKIDPPTSISQGEPGEEDVLVLIGPAGQLAVNGTETDEKGLSAAVTAGLDAAPAVVRLKADGAAPAETLVAVMERLREAGVLKVRLLTVTGGDS